MIVSHYERDLNWLKNINSDIDIVIYNKGKNVNKSYIDLPNIGREPHTFFQYIVHNYDKLTEWTILSQDGPHEHVRNWESIINGGLTTWETAAFKNKNAFFFSDLGILSCPSTNLPIHWDPLPIQEIWETLFDDELPDTLYFVPTCHIITHKDVILSKPIEFYKKTIEILENSKYSPWTFERLMSYVFNPDVKIKI